MRVQVKLLKDGSGRVCHHWFERIDEGPMTVPYALHPGRDAGGVPDGTLVPGPAKGRIACSPKSTTILPQQRGDMIFTLPHSDDPRAVTCPECKATAGYKAALAEIESLVPV